MIHINYRRFRRLLAWCGSSAPYDMELLVLLNVVWAVRFLVEFAMQPQWMNLIIAAYSAAVALFVLALQPVRTQHHYYLVIRNRHDDAEVEV